MLRCPNPDGQSRLWSGWKMSGSLRLVNRAIKPSTLPFSPTAAANLGAAVVLSAVPVYETQRYPRNHPLLLNLRLTKPFT